jgi:hypothetical protein
MSKTSSRRGRNKIISSREEDKIIQRDQCSPLCECIIQKKLVVKIMLRLFFLELPVPDVVGPGLMNAFMED